MGRPIFDHFRFLAPLYDHVFNGEHAHRELVEPLDLPVDGWLLDAGGGTGRIAQGLRDHAGGVIVVDVSHGMLRQARIKTRLHPTLGQAECLPFPGEQFDRILIVDAFHHFYAYDAAARDLWRVLKPGGRLLIMEPNIARWQVKLIALAERAMLMRSRFFTADEMFALFSSDPQARVTVDTESNPFYIYLTAEKTPASS
jgi:ubiquinone/menaquinone biosynthesis C-methylase UbiE